MQATPSNSHEYDAQNIFAKIIRKEVPCKEIYRDEFCMSFLDIRPMARTHALVIPINPYVNYQHFIANAPQEEQLHFFGKIKHIAEEILGLQNFKLINNNGRSVGQTVFHMHFHITSNEASRIQ